MANALTSVLPFSARTGTAGAPLVLRPAKHASVGDNGERSRQMAQEKSEDACAQCKDWLACEWALCKLHFRAVLCLYLYAPGQNFDGGAPRTIFQTTANVAHHAEGARL